MASRRVFPLQRLPRPGLAAVAVAGCLIPCLPQPKLAAQVEGSAGLRIESLDVSAAPDFGPPNKPEEPKAAWRTTFGSERRSQDSTRPPPDPAAFEADIVLLQGVTAVRTVRRVFPARDWRVVFSRQLLMSDDPLDPWSRDAVSARPVTAVAVRYREGLRVTGQEHLLGLMEQPVALAAGAISGAAGTAVRVQYRGRSLWAVSVSLAATCKRPPAECPPRRVIEDWRAGKRALDEAVIIGGALDTDGLRPLPPPPCSDQAIEMDTGAGGTGRVAASSTPKKGCVAAAGIGP